DIGERLLVPARGQVAVERVVAEVGFSADEPSCEGRPAVVEHLHGRLLPVHELRLLRPETFLVLDGAPVEFAVSRHRLRFGPCHPYFGRFLSAWVILSSGSSTLRRRHTARRKGSIRRSISLAASPSCCASACSMTCTARSMSPGKVAGFSGLASSGSAVRCTLRLPPTCTRCCAAFISSSIE